MSGGTTGPVRLDGSVVSMNAGTVTSGGIVRPGLTKSYGAVRAVPSRAVPSVDLTIAAAPTAAPSSPCWAAPSRSGLLPGAVTRGLPSYWLVPAGKTSFAASAGLPTAGS
jgi:hypothetical protein